ncbi:hypothetical protein IB69_000125 [Xanthomonas citri]|nr:hypothetical protein IB69_000125 [Xanthomonas citri]
MKLVKKSRLVIARTQSSTLANPTRMLDAPRTSEARDSCCPTIVCRAKPTSSITAITHIARLQTGKKNFCSK